MSVGGEEEVYFLTRFSIASMLGLLGRCACPLALLRFNRRSRSRGAEAGAARLLPPADDGVPFPKLGRADNWSPLASLAEVEPFCATAALPIFCSCLNSRYCLAASESGIGHDSTAGASAPFCSSSSATAKGFLEDGEVGREVGAGAKPGESVEVEEVCLCENPLAPAEAGDAGSAAASARKMAWVLRLRS